MHHMYRVVGSPIGVVWWVETAFGVSQNPPYGVFVFDIVAKHQNKNALARLAVLVILSSARRLLFF